MLKDNLKKLRKQEGYSKLKLEAICGISRRTIMLIETGRSKNPRIETVKKLAETLNVSVDELLKWKKLYVLLSKGEWTHSFYSISKLI